MIGAHQRQLTAFCLGCSRSAYRAVVAATTQSPHSLLRSMGCCAKDIGIESAFLSAKVSEEDLGAGVRLGVELA